MKQVIFMIISTICFGSSLRAQQPARHTAQGNRILVAYFSCTGTTQRAAEAIADATGGTIYRITPATAYTSDDLDWNDKSSRSSVEMADPDSRPALGGEKIDPDAYDVILLGYPIWWNACPRPVNSFIETYGLQGKTVIPFATSGSSSIAGSVQQLRHLYPKIAWGEGKLLNGGPRQARQWADEVIE